MQSNVKSLNIADKVIKTKKVVINNKKGSIKSKPENNLFRFSIKGKFIFSELPDNAFKNGMTDAIEKISDTPAIDIRIGSIINCFLLLLDRCFQIPLNRISFNFLGVSFFKTAPKSANLFLATSSIPRRGWPVL